MKNLARRDARTPEVQAAAYVLPDPHALDRWLRDVWTVVPDPPDAEFIMAPVLMLGCAWFAGDCDDAATLAASILLAMGIRPQLVAIRQASEADFSHVFARVPWLPLDIDPIVPVEHMPVRYAEAMVVDV